MCTFAFEWLTEVYFIWVWARRFLQTIVGPYRIKKKASSFTIWQLYIEMLLLLIGKSYTSTCSIRLSLCCPNLLCFMYIFNQFLLWFNTYLDALSELVQSLNFCHHPVFNFWRTNQYNCLDGIFHWHSGLILHFNPDLADSHQMILSNDFSSLHLCFSNADHLCKLLWYLTLYRTM